MKRAFSLINTEERTSVMSEGYVIRIPKRRRRDRSRQPEILLGLSVGSSGECLPLEGVQMLSDQFMYLMSGPPVRKVVRRSHTTHVGWFASRKFDQIGYESHLERDFLRLCEADPAVTFLREQPCTLFYADENGVTRDHTPDFALVRNGAAVIVETKYADDAAKYAYRTKVLTRELALRGIAYEMMTEHEIRREPRLGNAVELLRGRGTEPSPEFAEKVLELLLASANGVAVGDIPEILGVARDARYAVYAMILDGAIRLADPDAPLTPASKLIVGGGR